MKATIYRHKKDNKCKCSCRIRVTSRANETCNNHSFGNHEHTMVWNEKVLWTVLWLIHTIQWSSQTGAEKGQKPRPPNVVIFLADDLGVGDVGCFGNDTIKTPNIDSLCQKGVKLTHHLAADAICTPSRAALMTGRLPIRSGMATNDVMPAMSLIAVEAGLPRNETTMAAHLKKAGYKSALIGKWHLGLSCESLSDYCHHPITHGFDYFFGLPLSNFRSMKSGDKSIILDAMPNIIEKFIVALLVTTITLIIIRRLLGFGVALLLGIVFYSTIGAVALFFTNIHIINGVLMRNFEVVEQPFDLEKDLAERLVNEGVRYLKENAVGSEQPFLLFMSWVQVHNALHASERFQGKSVHGPYGDDVEELDWSVGQIMNALEEFQLLNNTIVYFSSDNGGHIEEYHKDGYRTGGHNGIFRGSKGQGGQEGGIREPTCMMWPGKLPAGTEFKLPTSQTDVFPTLMAAAGLPLPSDRVYDGKDLMPWLEKKETNPPHKFLFHHCGVWLHAVRFTPGQGEDVFKVYYYWPDWKDDVEGCDWACTCKLHHHKLDIPIITNIERDPSERSPLEPGSKVYKYVLEEVERAVRRHNNSISPVPNQLEGMGIGKFRPWLQPCCSFAFCRCSDNDINNALAYTPPWKRNYS